MPMTNYLVSRNNTRETAWRGWITRSVEYS